MEVHVKIHSLAQTTSEWIMNLIEIGGNRTLQIWVGSDAGEFLARGFSGAELPHPSTYDLLVTVIENLGGSIDRAVIRDLVDNTYSAMLVLRRGVNEFQLSARAFDAIMAASLAERPIYVEDALLKKPDDSSRG
jgi:uncharacterized protein